MASIAAADSRAPVPASGFREIGSPHDLRVVNGPGRVLISDAPYDPEAKNLFRFNSGDPFSLRQLNYVSGEQYGGENSRISVHLIADGIRTSFCNVEEIRHQLLPLIRKNAFGMKLHAFDGKFPVAQSHDHARA